MLKCHLSRLMGEHKVKVADVARDTGIHRHTVTALYKETVIKVDIAAIEKLCEYFDCTVCELFEYMPDNKHENEN